MKENIETKIVKIGDRDIEFYLWLTQDEEDHILDILSGGNEFEIKKDGTEMKFKATSKMLAEHRKARVEAYCKNLKWDEFSALNPKLREEVEGVINDIGEENKKK